MSVQHDMEEKTIENDKDLVQLAGYYAYQEQTEGNELEVLGKKFRVEHVEKSSSGMEAFIVRNITVLDDDGMVKEDERNEDGDLSIVYVGTQTLEDWTGTNLHLPGRAEPEQSKDALKYVEDLQNGKIKTEVDGVEKTLTGNLISVTGDSLGGGHAGRVGIEYPDINAVTLNPAPQAGAAIDPNAEYPNITNYYDEYDILVNMAKIGGLEHRIPGELIEVHSGLPIPTFKQILMDHTGYPEEMIDGEFKIEIGKEGEPGHGYIYTGVDEFIITDIWKGEPLYGDTELIDIDCDALRHLADSIEDRVIERLDIAATYLLHANDKAEHESQLYQERKAELQEKFRELLNQYGGGTVLKEIASTGRTMKDRIAEMRLLLNVAEAKCESANVILNSFPAEVFEYILSIDISVETLFDQPRKLLSSVEESIDDVTGSTQLILNHALPTVLSDAGNYKKDAVLEEVIQHYRIIFANRKDIGRQLKAYEDDVNLAADSFEERDEVIASAIETGVYNENSQAGSSASIADFKVVPSGYAKSRILNEQMELAGEKTEAFLLDQFLPKLEHMSFLLQTFKSALELLKDSLAGVRGNFVLEYVKDFATFLDDFSRAVSEAESKIADIIYLIDGWITALQSLIKNLPELAEYAKPYIETAILDVFELKDIQIYNVAADSILLELETVFQDIVRQLSQQQANSISELAEASTLVLQNITGLKEQINNAINALRFP